MNEDKQVKKRPETIEKENKVIELMNQDVRTKDIARVVNIHPNSVSRMKKDLSKFAISSDLKLARGLKKCNHKIVKDFMLDENSVKPSDVLKLSEMQQSRIDPVVHQVHTKNEHIVAVMTPESLDKYK